MHSPLPNLSALVAPFGRQKKYELDKRNKRKVEGPQAPNFFIGAGIWNMLRKAKKQKQPTYPRTNKSPLFAIRLFLIRLLLILIDGGLGDTVQITLAGLSDAATTLVLIGLKDTNLLEGLEGLAVDGAGGIDVVGGTGTAVLGGTVDLAKTADTDGLAHVDVAGTGGSTDVEPSQC